MRKKVNQRFYHLKRRYGIDEKSYNEILRLQGGRCAICGFIPTRFHVDHGHSDNKIRGILCPTCNVGLGYFRDSTELLEKAIGYLNNK